MVTDEAVSIRPHAAEKVSIAIYVSLPGHVHSRHTRAPAPNELLRPYPWPFCWARGRWGHDRGCSAVWGYQWCTLRVEKSREFICFLGSFHRVLSKCHVPIWFVWISKSNVLHGRLAAGNADELMVLQCLPVPKVRELAFMKCLLCTRHLPCDLISCSSWELQMIKSTLFTVIHEFLKVCWVNLWRMK